MTGSLGLPPDHPYRGAPVAVATLHRKTRTLARALGGAGGLRLRAVSIDTNAFGTFTGEVGRPGGPEETAVAKARRGIVVSGRPLAVASEGSFAPHPVAGFSTHQVELVVLVDAGTDLTVVGRAQALAPWADSVAVSAAAPLEPVAHRFRNVPGCLVVRPDGVVTPPASAVTKGIRTGAGLEEALRDAVRLAADRSPTGGARIETDLRAHVCPRRHRAILAAARDLAQRLASRCPACGSPGFGHVETVRGAPCARCSRPTDTPVADVHGCPACGHRVRTLLGEDRTGDPAGCAQCNP